MDAEVRNELKKIAASLAVIETRIGNVETEQRVDARHGRNFRRCRFRRSTRDPRPCRSDPVSR